MPARAHTHPGRAVSVDVLPNRAIVHQNLCLEALAEEHAVFLSSAVAAQDGFAKFAKFAHFQVWRVGMESELRRRALESMLRKKEGGVPEEGEVEDSGPEHEPGAPAKRQKVEAAVDKTHSPTPADSPGAARSSKWAADGDDAESDAAAAAAPAAAPAAGPPTAPPTAPAAKKSKWAEDDSDEEEEAPKAEAVAAAEKEDLVSEARGVGDAASALDLLEDRLGKRSVGAAGGDGEGEAEEGGGEVEEDLSAHGGEAVEPYDAAAEHLELHRCRDVDKAYQKLNKIDEGTYGVVYRARCRKTDKVVVHKQVNLRQIFSLTHPCPTPLARSFSL